MEHNAPPHLNPDLHVSEPTPHRSYICTRHFSFCLKWEFRARSPFLMHEYLDPEETLYNCQLEGRCLLLSLIPNYSATTLKSLIMNKMLVIVKNQLRFEVYPNFYRALYVSSSTYSLHAVPKHDWIRIRANLNPILIYCLPRPHIYSSTTSTCTWMKNTKQGSQFYRVHISDLGSLQSHKWIGMIFF